MIKRHYSAIAWFAVTLVASSFIPTLEAGERDKKTMIKLDRSIDVQGVTLPPGSYVISLLDQFADGNAVQIFSGDENHIIATILAVPASKQLARDHSDFSFYEAAEGKPPALHTWFYPGDTLGFEFTRPHR